MLLFNAVAVSPVPPVLIYTPARVSLTLTVKVLPLTHPKPLETQHFSQLCNVAAPR